MRKVYIYRSYERFWHWMQAALILILVITGFEVNGAYKLFGYQSAVSIHNITGLSLVVLIIFTIFWHFTTGEWRQYLPTMKNLQAQFVYYTKGIFEDAPHPTKKTTISKLNPLQRFAYLGLKLLLMPTLVITGLMYYFYHYSSGQEIRVIEAIPIQTVAYIHTFAAFLMIAFVIMHVYLTTTGHTPTSHLKAMITGWEELEEDEPETGSNAKAEGDGPQTSEKHDQPDRKHAPERPDVPSGTDHPGTDPPNTDDTNTDRPNTDRPNTDRPNTKNPNT